MENKKGLLLALEGSVVLLSFFFSLRSLAAISSPRRTADNKLPLVVNAIYQIPWCNSASQGNIWAEFLKVKRKKGSIFGFPGILARSVMLCRAWRFFYGVRSASVN